jgi:hypothetical protein
LKLRETTAALATGKNLLKGRDGLGFVVVGGEQVQQADHL